MGEGFRGAPQGSGLAPLSPAIFKNGILNQDYSLNAAGSAAQPGSEIQIFATGLAGNGTIFAKIGDRQIDQPNYAGPAPALIGVQRVHLSLPSDLSGTTPNA